MKKFLITSQIITVGAESEIYSKLLKSLKIDFRVKDVNIKDQQNITIKQLMNRGVLTVRTMNCLGSFVNHNTDMHIADFVRNYSWKEFTQVRNVGAYTLANLKYALLEIGYEW